MHTGFATCFIPRVALMSALMIAGCRPATGKPLMPAPRELDHVIVYVDSLERGLAWFEGNAGVRPSYLGKLKGKGRGPEAGDGTEAAVLALGQSRFLLLVAPDATLAGSGYFMHMAARYRTPTPVGWAVRIDQNENRPFHERAGASGRPLLREFSSVGPAGETLRWTTVISESHPTSYSPVFIQWDAASVHPGELAPAGCVLSALKVTHAQAASIDSLLEGLRLPDVVIERNGDSSAIDATLQCTGGTVRLGLDRIEHHEAGR